MPDGHYEMPPPFREENVQLLFNRDLAESRFKRDTIYKQDYANSIEGTVKKGYAERGKKRLGSTTRESPTQLE